MRPNEGRLDARGESVAVVSDRSSRSVGTRRVAIIVAAALSFALPTAAAAGSFFDQSAGKPSAGALPEYCQMGECVLLTVEGIDPILFSESGVLFHVLSQNWNSAIGDRRRRRGADTESYVFCSKRMPAVVDRMDVGRYMVTFLAPDASDEYSHANETSLAMYFVVCHGRAFKGDLMEAGPNFARSLGYAVKARDDQPTISDPKEILKFVR